MFCPGAEFSPDQFGARPSQGIKICKLWLGYNRNNGSLFTLKFDNVCFILVIDTLIIRWVAPFITYYTVSLATTFSSRTVCFAVTANFLYALPRLTASVIKQSSTIK